MKSLNKTTRIFIYIILGIALVYDIFIAIIGQFNATISYQTWGLSKYFPFFTMAYATLGTHLFLSKYGQLLFSKLNNIRYVIWIPIASAFLILNIINLFHPVSLVINAGNDLIYPYVFGHVLGLLWFQED